MASSTDRLISLADAALGFLVLIILGIVSYFVTIFVIVTGAEWANISASGDFVVLSASLLVMASILAGGLTS